MEKYVHDSSDIWINFCIKVAIYFEKKNYIIITRFIDTPPQQRLIYRINRTKALDLR